MAHATEMTMERLEAVLAAYGAQPARWPADEREAAEALIAASDAARGAFADAARLDAALDAAAPPPPADRLAWRLRALMPHRETVVAPAAPSEAARRRTGARSAASLARAAAVAAAVLSGVGIGLAIPHGDAPTTAPGPVAVAPQPGDRAISVALESAVEAPVEMASEAPGQAASLGVPLIDPVGGETTILLADLPLQ